MDKQQSIFLFKHCFGDLPLVEQEKIFQDIIKIIEKTQYNPFIGNKD